MHTCSRALAFISAMLFPMFVREVAQLFMVSAPRQSCHVFMNQVNCHIFACNFRLAALSGTPIL